MPENSPACLADWLTYLETVHPKAIELGLERVDRVKAALQLHPEFPVILVGGTNGKGSTCAYLEAMLSAAGYRVGLYTSPHLLRYNERVRIQGLEADDAVLCEAFAAVDKARGAVSLSYFEFGTLAAVWLYARAEVDVAILEVGLGGRLDAVNVFDPACAIVTGVAIDHTEYLGDTREQIGFEKAGIFRTGRPAICGDVDPPLSLTQYAVSIAADLRMIGTEFTISPQKNSWHYRGQSEYLDLPKPAMAGAYQMSNAACALAALETLGQRLPVSENAIRQGLQAARAAGRFQIMAGPPEVVLDVAHNPQAAHALAVNLHARPCTGKTLALWAMLADKDISGVAQALQQEVDEWLLAPLDVPRGAPVQALHQALDEIAVHAPVTCCENVAAAWRLACERALENDRICAFGSFYTVAEVLLLVDR